MNNMDLTYAIGRSNMKIIVDQMPSSANDCLFGQQRQSHFLGIPYRMTFCKFREHYSKRENQQCLYEKTGKCPYLLVFKPALKQGSFEDQINE